MAFEVVEEKKINGYEKVLTAKIGPEGLKAIVAIHNTNLGPALGGVRMYSYDNEEKALTDALRLSRGMSFKASVAGVPLGGGKAVIIGNPLKDKLPEMWRDFGKFVDSLNGEYITAEDIGTTLEDMSMVSKETKHVTGLSVAEGGNGDPSPVTSCGVVWGIRASLKTVFGSDSLKGKKFAIQGLGKVGYSLAKNLADEGAIIYVADTSKDRVEQAEKELGAIPLDVDEILFAEVDVISPCALGAVINDETIPKLKAKIIAGAANNQLADENKDGRLLEEKGIFYSPDFVINSGGLICVVGEILGYDKAESMKRAKSIYEVILKIAEVAKKEDITTAQAAIKLAEQRIYSGK